MQLPILTLQVLLCLDPSPPWDFFGGLVFAMICYHTINSKLDTGIGYLNHGLGSAIAICAVDGLYLLLLAKPMKNFKYIGNGKGGVHKVWWKKYFDVVCIVQSQRLIGWSHQVGFLNPCYRTESDHTRCPGKEHPSCPTTA